MSRLERLRQFDAVSEELCARLEISERLWKTSDQTMDDRRSSCANVVAAVTIFAKRLGVPTHAIDRLNDLCVALGELESGRTSALLRRANRPTRTPAASDLAQRAIAQVCVDLYRSSGLSAHEARMRTARLFRRFGFQNFSYSKIKSLGSSLTGPGASMDRSFDEYEMAKRLASQILTDRGYRWPPTQELAEAAAKRLVGIARDRDHRLAA